MSSEKISQLLVYGGSWWGVLRVFCYKKGQLKQEFRSVILT